MLINGCVNVMTGGTLQGIKIDALVLESRVIPDLPAMTAVAGPGLSLHVVHGVGFSMHRVAG